MEMSAHKKLRGLWEREGSPRILRTGGKTYRAVKSGESVNFIEIGNTSGIDGNYDSVSIRATDPNEVIEVITEEPTDAVPQETVLSEQGGDSTVREDGEGEQPAGDNGLLPESPGVGDVVETGDGEGSPETNDS